MMKRPLVILTILWLLAALARFAFFYEIRQALGVFLDWAPGLLLLGSGGVLVISWLVGGLLKSPRRPSCLVPSIGLVVLMILLWGMHLGPRIGVVTRLWRLEKEYLEVVDVIRNNPQAEPPECRDRIEIEPGPPLRVAFSWGGLMDNWSGIVHDPTGEVLTANDPDRSGEVTLWFGGCLFHAKHMWGPWYFCSFT